MVMMMMTMTTTMCARKPFRKILFKNSVSMFCNIFTTTENTIKQHLEIYVNLKMRSGGELFVINKSLQFACDCNTQQRH